MEQKNKHIIYIILISFFLGIVRFMFISDSNFTLIKIPDKIFSANVQKLSAIISNSDTTFSDPVIIDIEATYHLYQQGIVFLDARDKEDFEKQHILGAVNIPWHDIDNYEDILDTLNTFQSYVIYCSGGECSLSMDLAYYMLEDFTFDKIFIYEDGMPDWLERGYPVE